MKQYLHLIAIIFAIPCYAQNMDMRQTYSDLKEAGLKGNVKTRTVFTYRNPKVYKGEYSVPDTSLWNVKLVAHYNNEGNIDSTEKIIHAASDNINKIIRSHYKYHGRETTGFVIENNDTIVLINRNWHTKNIYTDWYSSPKGIGLTTSITKTLNKDYRIVSQVVRNEAETYEDSVQYDKNENLYEIIEKRSGEETIESNKDLQFDKQGNPAKSLKSSKVNMEIKNVVILSQYEYF